MFLSTYVVSNYILSFIDGSRFPKPLPAGLGIPSWAFNNIQVSWNPMMGELELKYAALLQLTSNTFNLQAAESLTGKRQFYISWVTF